MTAGADAFLDTLRRGGKLVVHSDTYAELKKKADPATWFTLILAEAEGRVIPNDLVEPGILYAVEKGAIEREIERAMLARELSSFKPITMYDVMQARTMARGDNG